MKYYVNKVAVLGSGLMGTGIAAHLANAGLEVLMLDMVPRDIGEDASHAERNKLAAQSLKHALKDKPAPFFTKELASRITIGNFDDDFEKIKDYDWIIEVVIERLDIKQKIFDSVDKYRSKGSLVSSNTSGIPIHMMTEGRSDDFKSHFLGTHFFNPPRYLRLLEIIPTSDTSSDVIEFFMEFGDRILGKQTVLAKDTPAFIANRIGVYAMNYIQELTYELELPLNIVDKLTGPGLARPSTGTFRLGDLVGLDTAAKVTKGIKENVPSDSMAQNLKEAKYIDFLLENEYYGNKSGQGFYKKLKEKDKRGKSIIKELNLHTLEYTDQVKTSLPSLNTSKQIEDPKKRIVALFAMDDKGGELIRRSLGALFAYASKRIPEVSNQIYQIDNALKAGFGWSYGPFEYWDIVGIDEGIKAAKDEGFEVADWVNQLAENDNTTFYKEEDGNVRYYDIESQEYKTIPGTKDLIILDALNDKKAVFQNDELIAHDIGDGVLNIEFRSKSNSIGEGVLRGINSVLDLAEEEGWKGVVIANNGKNFSVGANLFMIGTLAYQQEWAQLNEAVHLFQQTTQRIRYSSIPVAVATHGYVFGGGCEITMHTNASAIAAESYIGLVEAGVGLIPGGGGTKEFAVRLSDSFREGDVQMPMLQKYFKTIAMASVSTSALEAYDLGYLNSKDKIVMNQSRRISEAKKMVLNMADTFVAGTPRKDITVMGRAGLGHLYVAANSLLRGKYASEHDILIAKKAAYVMCGGDLTGQQQVSEKYLLDLEREAFLSLLGEQKTLERIQHMLETNKPLRN